MGLEAEREGEAMEWGFCCGRDYVYSLHLRCLTGKNNESSLWREKRVFTCSLFLVFCNRLTTSAVSGGALLALKYVSFPVQTLAKCAKMIPVMIWSTVIMQKVYKAQDYLLAFLVMLGCALFIRNPAAGDISPRNRERDSSVWGVSLMIGYLGKTKKDKLFQGYDMEIHNQIFYTTLCSCVLSLTGGNC